jgi:hypothetical protein
MLATFPTGRRSSGLGDSADLVAISANLWRDSADFQIDSAKLRRDSANFSNYSAKPLLDTYFKMNDA